MAKSKAQKAMAAGPSSVGSKARAAARAFKATRNGPKASETVHLQSQQFSGGKHASPSNSASVTKNVSIPMDSRNTGKHAPYEGKHSAKSNMTSVNKNNKGTDYIGKRRSGKSSDNGPVVHV